jgi:toxin YoeB
MEIIYTTQAEEDRKFWQKKDSKIIKRIDMLLATIQKTPFVGIGKPEPLRFEKSGYWSRRITHEHRLVYKVVNKKIYIAQCRYRY